MTKIQVINTTFENLIESYVNARSRAGISFLEMASICLKAKEQLKKKKWLEWLSDGRIKLKRTQANKLIAVAKICKQGGQSTDLLNKKGIEETYLLTKIQDDSTREELAAQIIDADFTVKQTRQVISKVQKENKIPVEAVEEIKNLPKVQSNKPERKTISLEEYNKLKAEYGKLLKEKEELENRLKISTFKKLDNQKPRENKDEILKEPVKSDLSEYTLNKQKRSVVIKGWELAIPYGIRVENDNMEMIKISALNNAKNHHNLDLT